MRSPTPTVHSPPSHPRACFACLAFPACLACRAYRACLVPQVYSVWNADHLDRDGAVVRGEVMGPRVTLKLKSGQHNDVGFKMSMPFAAGGRLPFLSGRANS